MFKKLNTTIENAVKPFAIGSGGRFIYVDTYTKLRDHCMKMEVEIKTKVEHPEQNGAVHDHNSPKVNFGCSEPWFVEGEDGTAIPFYLDPAAIGILIDRSQTTKGMGVHPNNDGHKCISDLIWEARHARARGDADEVEAGDTGGARYEYVQRLSRDR